MPAPHAQPDDNDEPVSRQPTKRRVIALPDGSRIPISNFKSTRKLDRDTLVYYHGETAEVTPGVGKRKAKTEWVTRFDPRQPLLDRPLEPGPDSPICKNCQMSCR